MVLVNRAVGRCRDRRAIGYGRGMRRRHLFRASVIGVSLLLVSTTAACGSDDPGSGEAVSGGDGWCEFGEQIAEQDLLLSSTDLSNAADIEATFSTLRDRYSAAVRVAPAEIRADVEMVKGAFDAFYDSLDAAGFELLEIDESAFEVFDAEVEAAGVRIDEYGIDECGFVDLATGAFDDEPDPLTEAEVEELLGDDAFLDSIRGDLVALFIEDGYAPEQAECLADVFDVEVFLSLETDDRLAEQVRNDFLDCGVDPAELDRLLGED